MREILFRGKLTQGREWAYGNLKLSPKGVAIITPDETVIGKYGQVDPETVGQYTGLKDINGVKIFEGDILDIPGWVVTYCADTEESLGMKAGWYIQRDNYESWIELENKQNYKVIGNIYDNPDLKD